MMGWDEVVDFFFVHLSDDACAVRPTPQVESGERGVDGHGWAWGSVKDLPDCVTQS